MNTPLTATSWNMPETQAIAGLPGVERQTCHQCQYGAATELGDPIRKATRWISNCPGILSELQKISSGRHGECTRPTGGRHGRCMGKTASLAAVHAYKFGAAILK